jgi:hypothetical protein
MLPNLYAPTMLSVTGYRRAPMALREAVSL